MTGALSAKEPTAEPLAPVASRSAAAPERTEQSRTLADRITMVVGSQLVTTLVTWGQSLLTVRLLLKEDYGALAFVGAMSAIGRELALLAIPESILYFAPKLSVAQQRGLIRQSMAMLTVIGVIVGAGIAGLSFAPSLFLEGRSGLSLLLVLSGVTAAIAMPASIFGNVFIATDNHRRAAGIGLIMTFVNAAGTLVPAALGWPVAWIIVNQAIGMALKFVLSMRLYRDIFGATAAEPFPGGVREQLRYVVPLAVTRFAGIFNQKLDKFLVGLFFAADAFANFAIGSQELPLVSVLPYAVASMLLPKLVEAYDGGSNRGAGARAAVELWHASIRKVTLVMVPVAVFLLVAAEAVMHVMYGEKYRAASAPLRAYSSLLLLRVTGYGVMLMAFGQTAAILRVQIVGMIFNVVSAYVLLRKFGMIGAPIAAVLTQAMMIVLLVWRIESVARVGLRGIFPWWHYSKVALAALLGAAPIAAAQWLAPFSVHPAILVGLGIPAFLAIYLCVAMWLGTMTGEDRAYVSRWLRLEPLRRKKASS